jgi:hypothetical protein
MNRFQLSEVVYVSLFALSVSSLNADEAAGSRPDAVFLLADDMGWAQPGFNGGNGDLTPNIDRLAAEGLRLVPANTVEYRGSGGRSVPANWLRPKEGLD